MKTQIIGFLLILLGLALGLYVGLWLCFVGGIVQIVTAIRAEELIALDIAWGIAKVVCAGMCGGFSALVLVLPGLALIQD